MCIKDLRPGMKNVTSTFIVIDKGRYIYSQNKTKRASVRVFSAVCSDAPTGTTNSTTDGSVVRKCRVADKTGSIFFSLWNEQAEAIESGVVSYPDPHRSCGWITSPLFA